MVVISVSLPADVVVAYDIVKVNVVVEIAKTALDRKFISEIVKIIYGKGIIYRLTAADHVKAVFIEVNAAYIEVKIRVEGIDFTVYFFFYFLGDLFINSFLNLFYSLAVKEPSVVKVTAKIT